MKQPKVSVIVPTFNSAKFIDACLQSVTEQSYKNIELIVVDNNSADDTKQRAQKYTNKVFTIGPERSTQRNYGVKQSTAEYVLIIDSDMELNEHVIKACVELVQNQPECQAVIIPEESIGKGFWAKCKKLERSFYINVDWIEAARFFSKKIFLQVGGYNETMISGEDWDLSQRVGRLTLIGRISELIMHNEGNPRLSKILGKKFYYARNFAIYRSENKSHAYQRTQVSLLSRYKLYFSNPIKLLRHPLVSLGMLYMKTCEFGFGAIGYLAGSRQEKHEN